MSRQNSLNRSDYEGVKNLLKTYREQLRQKFAEEDKTIVPNVPFDEIRWHIVANVDGTIMPIPWRTPVEIARDLDSLERNREIEASRKPPEISHRFTRSPVGNRGVQIWKIDSPEQLETFEIDQDNYDIYDIAPEEIVELSNQIGMATIGFLADEHGWLWGQVIRDDLNLWGRWTEWQQTWRSPHRLTAKDIPIKRINFWREPEPERITVLMDSYLDAITPMWRKDPNQRYRAVQYLYRWILYGLGHQYQTHLPYDEWDGRVHDRLTQIFPMTVKALMLWPAAHFSTLLQRLSDMEGGIDGKKLPVRRLTQAKAKGVAKKLFPGKHDYRDALVIVPEADAALMLECSNYSHKVIGFSTSTLTSLATLIDCQLFAPTINLPYVWLYDKDPTEAESIDLFGRLQAIMKATRISEDYFKRTEPDTESRFLNPIGQRKWKNQNIQINLPTAGFSPPPTEARETKKDTRIPKVPLNTIIRPGTNRPQFNLRTIPERTLPGLNRKFSNREAFAYQLDSAFTEFKKEMSTEFLRLMAEAEAIQSLPPAEHEKSTESNE
ncbi:MAG TPA: hypothetical protein V6D29_04020 [Leptolyngbyaceae cyanobacterium]